MSNGWRHAQASILGIFAANALYCALSVPGLGPLIPYSLLASRASRWFHGSAGRRVLDGLSGSALLAAAGTVAGNTLGHR
jgi:threonine/homoserine/homoserine lactone efflux protein